MTCWIIVKRRASWSMVFKYDAGRYLTCSLAIEGARAPMILDVLTSLGSNAACNARASATGPLEREGHSTRPLAGTRRSGREPILAISQPHSDLDTAMASQKSTGGRQK